ncbi:MAG TPA: glycosyltransferase [Candidatus Saccharimonadales bacterium]|nr:glycosyltransferase [Candidatus Saccharimonadales bacterium]
MEKKTLHVIEKYFYPVTAGIEVNMAETYSKLTDRWNITMHTSKNTLTEVGVLPDTENIKGINVQRYTFGKFGYWPKIDYNNTDYIALHNFNVFPHFIIMAYVLWLKIIGRKKFAIFLTPHGGFNPEWSIFPKWVAIIKSFYHFTLGTLMINLSIDGVRAVSNWERAEMLKKGLDPKKVVVIDNGIEDEAYWDLEEKASPEIKAKVASYGRYIIQVGRVYPIKNYETVIRAMVDMPKDLKYLIVGPIEINNQAGYKKMLDNLITELGLQDRVLFLGVIKGADKFYIIKHAQMMVHMAIWESFCNVVHEGLSQGLVCIVANNTALPFLIKDQVNGYCVETKDAQTVAEKVNFVLQNKDTQEIKDMQSRNREYGLKNSWKDVSERMYKFYTLVGQGRLKEYDE